MMKGLYWPMIFYDTHKKVVACHKWYIFEGKRKFIPFPLKPIQVEAPFQQWGLYFIEEINPHSSRQHKWILTATDYFTKWIEAIPTRQATETIIMKFLEEHILSKFGVLGKIITTLTFKSKKIITFYFKYQIQMGHSTAYYPQGNGLAESSNKSLMRIIKK